MTLCCSSWQNKTGGLILSAATVASERLDILVDQNRNQDRDQYRDQDRDPRNRGRGGDAATPEA